MIEIILSYDSQKKRISCELQKYRSHNQLGPFLHRIPIDCLENNLVNNHKPFVLWLMTKSQFLVFPINIELNSLFSSPSALETIHNSAIKIYERIDRRKSWKKVTFARLSSHKEMRKYSDVSRNGILIACHCYVFMNKNQVDIECFFQYRDVPYLIPIKYPYDKIEDINQVIQRDLVAEKKELDIMPSGISASPGTLMFKCIYPEFWRFFKSVQDISAIPYHFYTKADSIKPSHKHRVEYRKNSGIDWIGADHDSIELQLKQYLLSYYLETKSFEVLHDFLEPLPFDLAKSDEPILPNNQQVASSIISSGRFSEEPIKYLEWKDLLQLLREKGFRGEAKEYQNYGVQWMLERYYSSQGLILADEMGLGKTLQVLLLIALVVHKNDKVLIITPSSLKNNWYNEVQKFLPDILPLVSIDEVNIITIVSYEHVRNNINRFTNINFKLMVLDECQKIKNSKTQLWQTINKVAARQRILLTGTPIENSYEELLNHLQFSNNGVIHHQWEIISANQSYKELTDEEKVQVILCFFQNYILSRKKDDYLSLPPIKEQVECIVMEPKMRKAYDTLSSVYRYGLEINKGSQNFLMLDAILRLRQICSMPEMVQSLLPSLDLNFENKKMQETCKLLGSMVRKHKIVFFATFISVLDYFSKYLQTNRIDFARIDGSTESGVRALEVKRFNENVNCRVFLCTLHTGGVGLNLTAADTVLLYNLWWNPAVENQAISRVHRLGQEKDINVIKLVYKDSVEEKMIELIKRKQSLQDVFHSNNLSMEDYKLLLGY